MNIFNIIGPAMIGPSSSHTAGACRIGHVVYLMTNGQPLESVKIELSGSFRETYKGHGTDRALLAGIMGYATDSEEIRDALDIARDRGIDYSFIPCQIPNSHPNTVRISYRCKNGEEGSLQGASIGGGNIRIDEVDHMALELTGERTTCLVLHWDVPGVIADVTSVLSNLSEEINICTFTLSRQERGGLALMGMEFDNPLPAGLKESLLQLKNVENVIVFEAI